MENIPWKSFDEKFMKDDVFRGNSTLVEKYENAIETCRVPW